MKFLVKHGTNCSDTSRKLKFEIPHFCGENVIYLKPPKLHKKIIFSDLKNNFCNTKLYVCDT